MALGMLISSEPERAYNEEHVFILPSVAVEVPRVRAVRSPQPWREVRRKKPVTVAGKTQIIFFRSKAPQAYYSYRHVVDRYNLQMK